MGARIAGINKNKLKSENEGEKVAKCVCTSACPVKGECKIIDSIYECVLQDTNGNNFKYIGKSSTVFSLRYANHKKDMKNPKYAKFCELSKKSMGIKKCRYWLPVRLENKKASQVVSAWKFLLWPLFRGNKTNIIL